MEFVHHDLGHRSTGEIVEITLSGNAANVRLMDSSNFQSYRNNQQHRCIGGLAKKSPVRLRIPNSGHWHVAVDLAGLGGSVRSSARILPRPMPTLTEILYSPVFIWIVAKSGRNEIVILTANNLFPPPRISVWKLLLPIPPGNNLDESSLAMPDIDPKRPFYTA